MLVKTCIIVASLASAAMAQVGSIFCQARYITNVATCVIGVQECNTVEAFSACVCANTGNKHKLRLCVISLLTDPAFQGTLHASDYKKIFGSVDEGDSGNTASGDTPTNDSPTNDSPTNDSPTNDSPTNDSPTNDSPTNDSPTNDSPTNDTPTNDTPTNDTPTKRRR